MFFVHYSYSLSITFAYADENIYDVEYPLLPIDANDMHYSDDDMLYYDDISSEILEPDLQVKPKQYPSKEVTRSLLSGAKNNSILGILANKDFGKKLFKNKDNISIMTNQIIKTSKCSLKLIK